MQDRRTIQAAEGVITRVVGEELVLLDLPRGVYYGLDPVGTRAWELLATGATVAEVSAAMLEEFEVAEMALNQDLETLIDELVAKKLVTVSGRG